MKAKKPKIPRISKLEETAWLQLKIFSNKWGIDPPRREYKFHDGRRWRFDFAWPDHMIAIEVEGGIWKNGRHNRGSGFEKDAEKYNWAVLGGWRVIRVTKSMLDKVSLENYMALLFQLDRTVDQLREVTRSMLEPRPAGKEGG